MSMFIHLGKNESVYSKELIGIFDLDSISLSGDTKAFLTAMQEEKKVINLSDDIPEGAVLADNEFADRLYLVKGSSGMIYKRTQEK